MNLLTPLKTGLRATVPVLALLALAACSGDAPLPLGPDEVTSGATSEQTSSTAFTTTDDGLILELCKSWSGSGINPSVWFDFEIVVEREGEVIFDETVSRNTGTGCGTEPGEATILQAPSGSGGWQAGDEVTITEVVTEGYELGLILLVHRSGEGSTEFSDPEEPTVTFTVGDVKRVYFKNREAPPEEPETFTFELCKTWVGLGDGPDRTWSFTLEVNGEAQDPVEVTGFDCVTVGPFDEGTDVVVAEIVPDGFELGLIEVHPLEGEVEVHTDPVSPSVSFEVPAVKKVVYGNREVFENGGGEGCTPGFWRQPQHYEFWTGFDPDDTWGSVFGDDADISAMVAMNNGRGNGPPANAGNNQGQGNNNGQGNNQGQGNNNGQGSNNGAGASGNGGGNAGGGGNGNPGGNEPRSSGGELTDETTLGEAVQLQGGGLNALARHAVAALLNAASPDVDYDLTIDEIIDLVNDAIASGEYEDAKNILEAYNEQGCDVK